MSITAQDSTTAIINQMVPVGTIVTFAFAATNLPPGWLLCDGSNFNNNTYPDLYQLLGNSNVLPDLRGYFLRGLDPTGNIDPDGKSRSLLSVQADALKQHQHTYNRTAWFWNECEGGGGYLTPKVQGTDVDNFMTGQATSETGDAETRPKNVAVNYLIFAGIPRMRTTT